MTDEMILVKAQEVYRSLCEALDHHEWHYEKDDKGLVIRCGTQGDDLPMDIKITVSPERQAVFFISHLPYSIPEDKRLDLAVAVNIVNHRLVDGCFDYDMKFGNMLFRMTNSFLDSNLSNEVFTYMIFYSVQTIDNYNDKFLMLAKDMMSIEQFMD